MKRIFKPGGHSSDDTNDGGKEDEESGGRSARFAEPDAAGSPGKKKGSGKKEVRVQEPASEDGEQPQKAKATSVKKSADKKGPPSVSSVAQ